MNKIIVTTTINEPTKATLAFASRSDWHLIVVGDLKTPHHLYKNLTNVTYLSPDDQEKISKELSDAIGWGSIRRRNLGFIMAYRMGADVLATVDDDNIPYENWGENLLVGRQVSVEVYSDPLGVFDPLSVTEHNELWHRGFPLQYVSKRNPKFSGVESIKCLVQADLWNGDPDIDAVCRITKQPNVMFQPFKPYTSSDISPFNSQNTFIHRDVIPHYMVIPHVGRMDDIWGSYAVQQELKEAHGKFVVYNQATVYQERNDHDLIVDMEQEMMGYRNTIDLLTSGYESILPEISKKALKIYKNQFK